MAEAMAFSAIKAQLRLPIIAAPMFLISGPDLVIATARAGIIGAFPAPNARTIEDLERWLVQIDQALGQANRRDLWAINMIVHRSYARFDEEIDLIRRYQPRIVVTALGSPARALDAVHGYGGLVFADVIDPLQARKAIDAGADGIIAICAGAGGHTGTYSPLAFVEEIRSFWNGPLVVGGAVGSGRAVRAAQVLGADLAYVGTRFIAARESMVSDANREMLVRAQMHDIVATKAITGVLSNWMRESVEAAGFDDERLAQPRAIDFSNPHDVKAWRDIWGAGHSVGRTTTIQSADEIVDDLLVEFNAARSA